MNGFEDFVGEAAAILGLVWVTWRVGTLVKNIGHETEARVSENHNEIVRLRHEIELLRKDIELSEVRKTDGR